MATEYIVEKASPLVGFIADQAKKVVDEAIANSGKLDANNWSTENHKLSYNSNGDNIEIDVNGVYVNRDVYQTEANLAWPTKSGTLATLEDISNKERWHNAHYQYLCDMMSAYGNNNGALYIYPIGTTEVARNDATVSTVKVVGIPWGVTSIGTGAFSPSTLLERVRLPEGITSFGDSAFNMCKALTKIRLPDSLVTIGPSAFNQCVSLTEIVIPKNVTTINYYAFANCSALKTVTISKSVKSIGSDAFSECTKLTDVYYEGTQAEWSAISISGGNSYLENATMHYNCAIVNE